MNKHNAIIEELLNLRNVILRKNDDLSFSKFSPSFVFTTENISSYLNQLDVEGKDLLVPCASGDHAFEALNKGANSVDMFDINAYSYHVMQLKVAAIKVLSQEEFFKYFLKNTLTLENSDDILNKDVYYSKIRKELSIYSRNFWDQVYNLFKNGENIHNSRLLINAKGENQSYINLLDYLKEENYELLKEKLYKLDEKNSKFFNYNIVYLPTALKKKYDLILLSNIQHYIQYTYGGSFSKALKKYRTFVDTDLSKFLNDDGKIVSEYYYYYDDDKSTRPDENQTILEVPAIYSVMYGDEFTANDAVLIYQKKINQNKKETIR